jgi:hypothetical protein
MIICDLCGEARDCLQKEIDGKEYDICSECWNLLAQKLRGKGRAINREIVLLPPPTAVKEQEDEERPGEPPKIWGACLRPSLSLWEVGASVDPEPRRAPT